MSIFIIASYPTPGGFEADHLRNRLLSLVIPTLIVVCLKLNELRPRGVISIAQGQRELERTEPNYFCLNLGCFIFY